MKRLLYSILLGVSLLLALPGVPAGARQEAPGAICVSTFADLNGNGVPDSGESPLAGVNVNLSTGGVIIAAHVMTSGETQFCFENLASGIYTVTFTDSPTYRMTTSSEGTFALASGQRLTINAFGAVPVPPADLRAQVAAQIEANQERGKPLETPERLLLSTVAAMVAMIFMVGLGGILLGFLSGRRRAARPAGLPPSVVTTERDRWQ